MTIVQAIIVGAGASGVLHALALRAAGVRIAVVYDPDEDRARAVADACGARTVGSLEDAASADACIAAICSPPSLHAEQVEKLASSGRVVFVEKPVATTRGALDRMRSLRCVPILQWRSGRALRALRRAIAHGELGPAPVVSCDLAWGRDDEYFRARRAWGCGALLSVGIHAIDAIGWALGRDILSAAGVTASARDGVATETAAVAVMRLSGGAMASLRISLDGGGDATRITVCGDGKSVHLAGGEADPTGGVLQWSALRSRDRERLEALERDTPGALGSPLLVPYLGSAIAALRDGEAPGQSQRLLSIDDSFGAHAAAMCVAGAA
jgi:predicted dehydrogenase